MFEIVPAIDPIPLPAPVWLLKALLMLTFVLHIVAMNFLLGGTVIALVTRVRGGQDANCRRLTTGLFRSLPAFFAATITLGVAPFLFVQTLYGPFIFTSSILMGWPWLSVVLAVTLAYYGMYTLAFGRKEGSLVTPLLSVVLFLLCAVAFLYTNNFTLMLHPEKWQAMYHASPSGTHMHLSEPMLIPRFLHFVVGAVAIGSLSLIGAGYFNWNRDREFSKFLFARAAKWFFRATIVQIGVGLVFLVTLPTDKVTLFLGKSVYGTILFLLALAAIGGALKLMSDVAAKDDPRKDLGLGIGCAALTLVAMALMRDVLRDSYLAPYLEKMPMPVEPQWDILGIFVVLLVSGLALWAYMMKLYFFPSAKPAGE